MNYGNIKYNTIEDGVGCRTVLFVSGCRNRCPGCFQKQTWDFSYGRPFDDAAEAAIMESLESPYIRGLTLCGGEPFEPENQKALLPFVRRVRDRFPGKDVWSYSGYTFEELVDESSPVHTKDTMPLLGLIDVLVDGKFVEELANRMLPYRGSSNQRVLDMRESLSRMEPVPSEYGIGHSQAASSDGRR